MFAKQLETGSAIVYERNKRFSVHLVVLAILVVGLVAAMEMLNLPLCGYAQESGASTAKPQLGPFDTYFVTQTSLGTPFQIDSGRIAQRKGGTGAIRAYAGLMVSSHMTVNDILEEIVKRKAAGPPPTLLKAANATILCSLETENGQKFDADYVRSQVKYQKANAALYYYELDNGTDPDLKAFAERMLPKILDHLERALNLEQELKLPYGQSVPAFD